MSSFEYLTLLFNLVLPVVLIGWVALARQRTRTAWALDVAIAAVYVTLIGAAGLWLALPPATRWILALLLAVAVAIGARRMRERPAKVQSRSGWVGAVLQAMVFLFLSGVTSVALAGRQPIPVPAVELTFPLRGGDYLIAGGGSREVLNPHLRTLTGERARPYRGQSYAVDIVRIGGWGSRRSAISPGEPQGYAIFGDSIFAPCSGTVVRSSDGQPDRLERGQTPETLEGNHVLLECDETWVLLAHMRRGSVTVQPGDRVDAGDHLGNVGNSGRSDEPHLHLHAQTPGTVDAPLGGDPLPVSFDGRQLARNDRVPAG